MVADALRPPVVRFTLRVLESLDLDSVVRASVEDMVDLFRARGARVADGEGRTLAEHGELGDGTVLWRFKLPEGMRLELAMDHDPDLAIIRQQFVDLVAVVRRAVSHALVLQSERREAREDPLTGAENRRSITGSLDAMIERAVADNRPLAVMMLDLDHFKAVNDGQGHAAGDDVLKAAVEVVRQHLRDSDRICRWGGDEFLVVFEGVTADEAEPIAERLREAFADHERARGVTMSIGLADLRCLPVGRITASALIDAADGLLYRGKRAGRNRIFVAPAA